MVQQLYFAVFPPDFAELPPAVFLEPVLDELFFVPELFEPVELPDLADAVFEDPPAFFAVDPPDFVLAEDPEPDEEDFVPVLPVDALFDALFVPELEPADLPPPVDLAAPPEVDFFEPPFAEEEDDLEADDFAVDPDFFAPADLEDPELPELDFDDDDFEPPVDFADPLAEVVPPFLEPDAPDVLTTAVAVPTAAPLTAPSAAP